MNGLPELVDEARRLSGLLDDALGFLRKQVGEAAQAEHDYRKAKATAWVEAKVEMSDATVPEKTAYVQGITAEARKRRDLSDGLRQAALEAVRSRRQQISLLQSIAAAHRSEAEFARTGPDERVPV